MPALSFNTAKSTGHDGWPPRPASSGSPNVYVNGKQVLRVSDTYPVHCNPSNVCHPGAVSSGSSTVFCNGLAAARIGDDISCGDTVADGSPDVFVGG